MTAEEIKLRLLDNIMLVTDGMTIGKRKAERIVGGAAHLARLHESGKVECLGKDSATQNGKWQYKLSDVLRHCRNLTK